MWKLRRGTKEAGGAAVADGPGSDAQLQEEIEELAAANRNDPDRDRERRLLALRHIAGIRALESAGGEPAHPEPEFDRLPPEGVLPEFGPADLTPGLVRAAILRDGFIMIRGLVERGVALRFAEGIDRAFAERERFLAGERIEEGWYEEFLPGESYREAFTVREWVRQGGGVLAVDSPMLSAEMADIFRSVGLPRLVEGYLGEQALISMQKTTLRKADPSVPGSWHQDGKFMGDVRALNLWLALSRCGDESPGLDMVPRRLDYLVTAATEEAVLDYTVSQSMAEKAAGDRPIIRPIFEPGDALLFDDMFLHSTGSDPSMPKPRFAIENWFFGASGFPVEYGPVAI
jgi:hypothetical protein